MTFSKKSKSLITGATVLTAALFLSCSSPKTEQPYVKPSKVKQRTTSRHFNRLVNGVMGHSQLKFLDEYLNGKISLEFPFSINRKIDRTSLEIEGWNCDDHSPRVMYVENLDGKKTPVTILIGRRVEKFTLIFNKPVSYQRAGVLAKGMANRIGSSVHGYVPDLDSNRVRTNKFRQITWFKLSDQSVY